jgi:predicted aminopeptidase
LLELNGGDLGKFYKAADRLAREPKTERHRWLRAVGGAGMRFPLPEGKG